MINMDLGIPWSLGEHEVKEVFKTDKKEHAE